MFVGRMLTVLAASVLMGGIAVPAQAQSASKAAKGTPKPVMAKPETAAAAASSAEPTLLGQFGTWGAYSATPNGKKVCFALAKPASSKTTPPNRPRDPASPLV